MCCHCWHWPFHITYMRLLNNCILHSQYNNKNLWRFNLSQRPSSEIGQNVTGFYSYFGCVIWNYLVILYFNQINLPVFVENLHEMFVSLVIDWKCCNVLRYNRATIHVSSAVQQQTGNSGSIALNVVKKICCELFIFACKNCAVRISDDWLSKA